MFGFFETLKVNRIFVKNDKNRDDRLLLYTFLVIGPPLEIGVRDLLLHDGAEPELAPAVVSDFRDRYRLRSCELTEKFDGVVDVLSSIRSKGVVTAIATSKPRDLTVQLLEHLGLTDLFDRVECQATVGWDSKTMVLRRLIEQIGTRPEMVVMVGDRSHDMEASAEVGARSVGVLWGYGSADELTSAGAEFLVASPPELLELLAADL